MPQLGESFQILSADGGVTGKFASAKLPTLTPGKMWQLRYSATAATLVVKLAGGYNDNGVVDAADYNIWKANFGAGAGAGARGVTLAGGVPEPIAALLVANVLVYLSTLRMPRRR